MTETASVPLTAVLSDTFDNASRSVRVVGRALPHCTRESPFGTADEFHVGHHPEHADWVDLGRDVI
jgi:hypothetical protein